MRTQRPGGTARRDLIVREAAQLFASRGFLGASLRDLAAASGIQQPSLYNHFESKEAILVEVVNRYFDALLPELRAASEVTGTGVLRLTAMIETSVTVGTQQRAFFLATSNNWELIRSSPNLHQLRDRRDEALALWRGVLKAGANDGSLRKMDPYHTLWIISSAISGMIDLRYAASDEDAPPVKTLIAVVIGGLGT